MGDFFNKTDLLEDEYRPVYDAWKQKPGPDTASQLLQTVDPVIQSALRTYGNPSPTLRSKAKLLVLDALPRYNPKQAKLRTHLMVNLQGLHRAQAEERQIVHIPERVRLDSYKLHLGTTELSDRLGRDPSDNELAKHTGLSLKRMHHIRQAHGGLAESQNQMQADESGTMLSGQGAVQGDPAKSQRMAHLFLYHDLDPVDQLILEHTTGFNGKPILAKGDIARKVRLSPGAVSQRAARIQKQLNEITDSGMF